MVKLFTKYMLRNGETVTLDGVSLINNNNGMPVDLYTSMSEHGAWNRKGQYMSNVLFGNNKTHEMDIIIYDERQ